MKRELTDRIDSDGSRLGAHPPVTAGEFDVVEGAGAGRPPPAENPEEIQRIQVDPEDRVAFRVGVNILTLTLIAVGAWLLWGLFQG